jgi:ribosomal protein L12E/L44/L45/RPP1/RPP2
VRVRERMRKGRREEKRREEKRREEKRREEKRERREGERDRSMVFSLWGIILLLFMFLIF